MGKKRLELVAAGCCDFGEVLQLRKRARSIGTAFRDFPIPYGVRSAFRPAAPIPSSADMGSIQWKELRAEARIPAKLATQQALADILTQGQQTLGKQGYLVVKGTSAQTGCPAGEAHEHEVSLAWGKLGYSFEYQWTGPGARTERALQQEFLQDTIRSARLPLTLGEKRGKPALTHTTGGRCALPEYEGFDRTLSIWCDMPAATAADLMERCWGLLEAAPKPRRQRFLWRMGAVDVSPEVCQQTYSLATQFPAQRYSLYTVLSVTTLDGLELLRRLCGTRDRVNVYFCSFSVPAVAASAQPVEVRLELDLREEGFLVRLQLEPGDERIAQQVGTQLGLRFKEPC